MSETTLYRKYRPQCFSDLIGQDHIAQTLRNEVQHNQLSHAYLFSGPRGVGKTTTARLLAKAANCQKPKAGEPDNTCTACTAITNGKTLDVIEIDAASYTGVDNIREVIEHSRFTPSQLQYKVFIIDEVHMLSTAAFNALLKTLEEPPAHALFILATTELHKVPETIISRCQRFDFHRLSDEDLSSRVRKITKLEDRAVDDEVVDRVVRLADGSSRDAESMLGQLFAITKSKVTSAEADIVLPRSNQAEVTAFVIAILANQQADALTYISKQLDEGVDLETFRTDTIRLLRDCMLYLLLPASTRPTLPTTLKDVLPAVSVRVVARALEQFLSASRYIAVSPLPQLPLELSVLQSTTAANDVGATPLQPSAPQERAVQAKRASSPPSQDLFHQIVQAVTKQAPMLSVPLKMVRLTNVDGSTYTLSGPYALHVERLQHPKAKAKLEEIASDVSGKLITIRVTHDTAITLDEPAQVPHNTPAATLIGAPTPKNPDQLWDQIVNEFTS